MKQETSSHEPFEYSYSAKQQEEIEHIRKKYALAEQTPDKLALLRQLDRQTTKKGLCASLTLGIISTLLLGAGMSCVLVWIEALLIPGILLGLAGIIGIILAYPLYQAMTQRERKKVAVQVLQLVEDLSEEKKSGMQSHS